MRPRAHRPRSRYPGGRPGHTLVLRAGWAVARGRAFFLASGFFARAVRLFGLGFVAAGFRAATRLDLVFFDFVLRIRSS